MINFKTKLGIIYWPIGGNVESIAKKIQLKIDQAESDIYDILSIDSTDLVNCNFLIIGGSTVGAETWQEAEGNNKWHLFFKKLEKINLKNKFIALYGLGNQILYPNHFVDNMMSIKKELEKHGVKIIGKWPIKDYNFSESAAVEGDYFCGLALDEENQPELTDIRIENWLIQLKGEIEKISSM